MSQITNPIEMSPAAGAGRWEGKRSKKEKRPKLRHPGNRKWFSSCGCGPETRKIEKKEQQDRNQKFPISRNENESCIVHRGIKTADQVGPCYTESIITPGGGSERNGVLFAIRRAMRILTWPFPSTQR